jgi:hypothetical protein
VEMMTRQFPAAADRQVAIGAACWVQTVVFFVGQPVAQAASPWTAIISLVVGVLGLVSFLLFVSAPSVGLGTGLVERLAGYPVVVWMIVVGCFLLWSATWSDRPRVHA